MSAYPNPKAQVFAAFHDLHAQLMTSPLIAPTRQSQPPEMLAVLPPGYSGIMSGRGIASFPITDAAFPFRPRMHAGPRMLFDVLLTTVLWANSNPTDGLYGWNSDDWLVTVNGRQTVVNSASMMFAINVCWNWAVLGDALEQSLTGLLAPYAGIGVVQVLPKERLNTPGPDGFVHSGGLRLGLPYDAFAIEAKAGDSALADLPANLAKVKGITHAPGATPRERYGAYITQDLNQRYRVFPVAQFAILLIGLSFTFTSDPPKLRGATADYFDGVLIFNVWGQAVLHGPLRR